MNNLVRLECEARGIPAPSLTWLKDGSPVSGFANGIQVFSVNPSVKSAAWLFNTGSINR